LDKIVEDVTCKDSFSASPGFYQLEEPCAEPDVEPAPRERQEDCRNVYWKPPADAGRQFRWQSFVAVLAALALVGHLVVHFQTQIDVADDAAQATISAQSQIGVPVDEAPEANESISEGEDGGSSSTYTVGLTRHSFPVQTVGDMVYYRSAYFGTVHVGTPAVPYTVVFDTGSGHLILPSTYCSSETCKAHRRYKRSGSKTAQDIDYDGTVVAPGQPRDQITVSFGTGDVTGVFVEDIVCMGEDSQQAIGNTSAALSAATSKALQPAASPGADADSLERGCIKLRLIAATAMSEEPFKSFQFDGVLGLGLDGLSQAPEFNFLNILAASFEDMRGGTPQTFAVFLAEDAEEESKITFGGWDEESLTEDLSWNSVVDSEQGHWTIRIKAIRVDDEILEICRSGCKGVVDTGTSLLAVPGMAFSELYTLLRHPAPMEGHCLGPGPKLHIELEHYTVTLEPEDYARLERTPPRKSRPRFDGRTHNVTTQGRTDLHCKPMLMSMDLPAPLGPKLFILGEPILRKYVSVYDAKDKRVGFARARHLIKPTRPLPPNMTPALKKDPLVVERSSYSQKSGSMFDAFRWRKLHRYN
jgi:hypothetical protein